MLLAAGQPDPIGDQGHFCTFLLFNGTSLFTLIFSKFKIDDSQMGWWTTGQWCDMSLFQLPWVKHSACFTDPDFKKAGIPLALPCEFKLILSKPLNSKCTVGSIESIIGFSSCCSVRIWNEWAWGNCGVCNGVKRGQGSADRGSGL